MLAVAQPALQRTDVVVHGSEEGGRVGGDRVRDHAAQGIQTAGRGEGRGGVIKMMVGVSSSLRAGGTRSDDTSGAGATSSTARRYEFPEAVTETRPDRGIIISEMSQRLVTLLGGQSNSAEYLEDAPQIIHIQ